MSGVVRSCVLPGQRHDELPSDAYACPACQRGLVRRLGEVEGYLATASAVPRRTGSLGTLSRQFASRPPADLTVVSMFDRRTGLTGCGPDDVLDEVINVHADLFGWLRILIAEHPDWLDAPTDLIAGVALLRSRCDWICEQPWVDEFASDVSRVHGALRQACGDAPPRPAGYCLDAACGGPVFRRSDDPRDPRLRCSVCRTTYDGLDLVRVAESA